MNEIVPVIRSMQVRDVIDIVLVAAAFYCLFLMLRGTRSSVALRGLITVLVGSFIIYALASVFDLTAMKEVFRNLWVAVLLLFIIVFQHDFRRSLTLVGQLRIFRRLFSQSGRYLDEVLEAARLMARRRIGGLLVFERRNNLRVFAETGTPIDASITAELLRTIFTAYTPLHDGAVILRDERVLAAGCILPLTADPGVGQELGTRHRAALGLSEETDAIVVVVSEETGIISVAKEGKLRRGLTVEELRETLVADLDLEASQRTE